MSDKQEVTEEAPAPTPKQATKRPAEVDSPTERTPGPKRKRKPAELYQSDVIDACSKQTRSSSDAKREVFLPKGAYVAVRSEEGFYLCQVLHYVYDDSVGPIQIQWMEKKANNIYELDYMDTVDRESVLTEVRLNPGGERGLKTLPAAEKERIDKILGFSLQKEKGLLHGVDSSNLDEAVTASIIMSKNQAKNSNSKKSSSASHKNGSFHNGQPSTSNAEIEEVNEKRPPARKSRGSRRSKDSDSDDRKAVVKLKHIKPIVKLHKLEEKKHAKRKNKSSSRISANSGSQQWKGANQNPNRGLKANANVAPVSSDRFLVAKSDTDMADNSYLMLCKDAIHAVLTNNQELLQRLIEDRTHVASVFVNRSVDIQENALLCAMQLKRQKLFDMLLRELFSSVPRVVLPSPVLDKAQPDRFHHTLMGHRLKASSAAKGAKEGNLAFTRDLSHNYFLLEPYLNIIQFGMKSDVPLNFLEKLAVNDPNILTEIQQNAYVAVRSGNRHLAGEIIKTCQGKETHGFHKLHEQVLLVDTPEELPHTSAAIAKKKSSDNGKITPFHCAAVNPNAKILAHLLTFYAGDTLTDQHGWSLLHYAAACTGPAPLALLLSRGAPVDTGTCRGLTPLMIASKLGRLQNVAQFLKPVKGHATGGNNALNIDRKDNNGFTALHFAAENGHVEVCRLLAKQGVDFECASSPNTDKVTPLILAARRGHCQTVQALVELGLYIEGRDKFKRTPLIHAAMNGHEPVVAYLLRRGVDPNGLDSSRNSPLHYAAGYGWLHCVKLLLQAGADPKALNDSKLPPHWVACLKGHLGCVELLLKEPGTDVNMRDRDGWTLVTMSVKFDLTPSELTKLQFLVAKTNADVTVKDFIGWNALHHLASNTSNHLDGRAAGIHKDIAVKMAKILIKNGCSPSIPTTNHESALSIAVKQKHLNSSLIHCLLENGAQLSLDANENGENILHAMSTAVTESSQIEMFDFLCEMLGKPELQKEIPTNNKLPTPTKELIQPPEIKDSSHASPAQMPILEQEANHIGEKPPAGGKPPEVNANKANVTNNEIKDTVTNNSMAMSCVKENKLPKISGPQQEPTENIKSASPAKVEKVTDMEVDDHPSKTRDKGTTSPVPQLVHLAAERDTRGGTPLLRLFQEYAMVCLYGAPRKNLIEDVITLQKGFIERAKSDINAMTLIDASREIRGIESRSCLHMLVKCEGKVKDGKVGATPVLAAFLSYKPDLNVVSTPSRRTPLIDAIREKKPQIVDVLLEAGADINFMSPLLVASQLHELTLVNKLVKKGADVKCQDSSTKDGPLHFIASASCDPREICATIKILLDAGADINGKNSHQRTPLHLAVNSHSGKADSSSQVVEFLLDNGADPFAQDSNGSIPLHIAFSKYPNMHNDSKALVDPIEFVCALTAAMKNKRIDMPDNNGNTPLHRAAQHGATISCTHLIKRAPDINAKNILDNTPLNLAVSMKQEGTTIALLQNDNVDVTNPLKVRARKYAEWEHKIEKFNKYWHWELMKPWQPLKTFNFSLISQVVQRQWHGVLFLLMDHLERAGLSKTAVVEAAIDESRFQLALSLLSKIKENKDVQAVNSQGQNLLHILMYIMPTKTTPLHLEVGKELLRRGVGLGLDKYECSPLTYAALDQSAEFCRMLVDHKREECLQLLKSTDVKGRSPLAAVFWRLDNDMQQLEGTLKFLLECGVTLDQNMPLPRRDLILQEPEMDPDDFYLFWDGPIGQFSPLIGAVLARDKSMVKLLLDLGADPNFADPDNVTPLMHAVKMNDLGIIKLLFGLNEKDEPKVLTRKEPKVDPNPETKTATEDNPADKVEEKMQVDSEREPWLDYLPQKIAVTAVDKYGRCAVHYMVSTCEYGTYENEEILAFFAKCKVPLDSKDASGKTVLDYAKELRLEKLLKGVQNVLNMPPIELPLPSHPVHQEEEPPAHRFDFNADAAKMLEKLKAQEVNDNSTPSSDKVEATVDPDSGCTEGSEILKDKEQNIPYSVFLTIVDVKQGWHGMHKYFKMQIIQQRQKGKEIFLLFTKSGRVGCIGHHQCTPYNSDTSATEEFKRIFKIKTGNSWSQFKEFKVIKGKFKLVNLQVPRSKKSKLSLDFSLGPPTKLSPPLKSFMLEATQQEPLEAVQKGCKIDMDGMPFGRLEEEVLLKAKGTLEEIRTLLEDSKREDGKKEMEEALRKHSKMQDIMEKVFDLSLDYYQLIPYLDFNLSNMLPLHTMVNLQQAERVIETLLALELTGKVLLGAQLHSKEVNILDYSYEALECKIDPLERKSQEAQLILQQIASSGRDVYRRVNVEAIYKLTRRGERERLNSLHLSNHKLLWHGIKAGSLLSTLKRGLVRSPSEVTSTGIMLGEGIRFSDTFSRGLQYCDAYQKTSKIKFMLLCEVSLGKEFIPEKPGDGLKEGFHHIKGEGSLYPDSRFDLRLPSGVVISMGKLIQGKSSLEFNEYVVQKESQVRLRYLLQFNQEDH